MLLLFIWYFYKGFDRPQQSQMDVNGKKNGRQSCWIATKKKNILSNQNHKCQIAMLLILADKSVRFSFPNPLQISIVQPPLIYMLIYAYMHTSEIL